MPDALQPGSTLPRFRRSADSSAFEAMWRGLPRTGLVPDRDLFKPEKAKSFLRNLILISAPEPDSTELKIRLVGSGVHQRIGRDVTGEDYVKFMGEERRGVALLVIDRVFSWPCGFWQVAPVHYERGFSHYWEMTAFPLAGNEKNRPMLLGHVSPVDGLLPGTVTGDRAMHVGLAETFEYIDIGAGVPPPLR
jgi:hypothetical protein